jgi:hypothetical protein
MRRIVLTVVSLLFLAAPLLPVRADTAHASEWWCWDDPVLHVDGQVVRILAGVPNKFKQRVTLAEVVVTVPNGVDARLSAINAPHFPQTATLVRKGQVAAGSPIPVTVTLTMHGHGLFDAGIRIVRPSGEELTEYGRSNEKITATITVTPRVKTTRTR